MQTELARHEEERKNANGTYEQYRAKDRLLERAQQDLNALLADMFRRAGQEPKPVHLAKRALLEARVADLRGQIEEVKKKNADVAALIEYDTVRDYAAQLRTTGFIWTKSRQRLLEKMLRGALTSRPVAAMMGETGTGKTALARAASIELSSREPDRTVGGDQEKFVRLLASPAITEKGTSYDFGPLLRAMTGLDSSRDDKASSRGGGIFFDDEFNTRPTSVQRQILKFVSEARPGRTVAVPGTPLTVTVRPGFLYLAAGNPPSERYDREETGIETKREFAGNVINVEFLEQTADNPELYQVLQAALFDESTGRLTAATPDEIQPAWQKADAATGESRLDADPKSGAFLWRFANAWGELFKAFSPDPKVETALMKAHPADDKKAWKLKTFILDPGVVFSWIDQYKADPSARAGHLGDFLMEKFDDYLLQFSEDDQKVVGKYMDFFALPKTMTNTDPATGKTVAVKVEVEKPAAAVLTPREVGYLNPNVRRPKKKAAPPLIAGQDVIDPETGEPVGVTDLPPVPPREVPETGKPFAYDRAKARELGFAELRIEAHPKAQELVDAILARDARFVTVDAAGKVALDDSALKAYWAANCADLPDVPAKSPLFFQWMAEHRLSDTIDGDNNATATRPTRPHVPRFGRPEFLLAMDWKEFEWNDAAEKSAAVSAQTKALLQGLFRQENVASISRNTINEKLFEDHEARVHTPEALAVIRDLIGSGQDPNQYELRLMRYDEYARAAKLQDYGKKNLWTWFEGYVGHGGGHRYGLVGGRRDYGGPAYVDSDHRDCQGGNLAVRLVLSRKG